VFGGFGAADADPGEEEPGGRYTATAVLSAGTGTAAAPWHVTILRTALVNI
jgi:hypothetical protein